MERAGRVPGDLEQPLAEEEHHPGIVRAGAGQQRGDPPGQPPPAQRRPPAAGHPEPFAPNLPGIPDNMSSAGDGTYWVAFPSPRLPLIDRLMPHPATRRLATRLPDWLQPAAQRYGLVAHLDANGQITQTLHGPSGSYREIVGVRQHDNWLYLGSLHETAVGRVPIPA